MDTSTRTATASYLGNAEQGFLGTMSLRCDDPRLERFVRRSLADLESLVMATASTPEDPFVAAGVPWFLTLFGRDSIWVARMLLPLGTGIALGTLRTLAYRQGATIDEVTAEEPGKILHELRREPASHEGFAGGHQGEVPLMLPPVYYGTVDATPLWVCLLRDAWRWGLSEDEVEPLLDPMERCLAWMRDYGMSANGFLSYVDRSRSGLTNQGWKDSHDAIQFHSGRLARAPVCLCEAQGYAYEAATSGAELLDAFGRPGGDQWREFAEVLAQRFRKRFWVDSPRGAFPAIAIDRDGVAVDALASNIGHLLGTGILDSAESELVATWLGLPDLDSGFGLRTLSANSAGFNPLGYHTGSVWAHDTAIAIAGLSATPGKAAQQCASSFIDGLLAAAEGFEFRMPELYGGQSRDVHVRPLAYPASCRPQAWSAASAITVVSTLAGLRPDVPAGRALLRPLPTGTALEVTGLRVAGDPVHVRIRPGTTPEVEGLPARLHLED
jgi:glycogen debranching enzyme